MRVTLIDKTNESSVQSCDQKIECVRNFYEPSNLKVLVSTSQLLKVLENSSGRTGVAFEKLINVIMRRWFTRIIIVEQTIIYFIRGSRDLIGFPGVGRSVMSESYFLGIVDSPNCSAFNPFDGKLELSRFEGFSLQIKLDFCFKLFR
jgi:hypothetical protein